jgi:nucleotide-binding universal stress UspA family protein
MSTLLIPSPDVRAGVLPQDWPGSIIVAADGRAPADAALVAAKKLAGPSTFGVLAVVSVGSSIDRPSPRDGGPPTLDSLRDAVSQQVHRMLGDDADTWIELRTGYPPAVLASFADTHAVSLLVVGVGRPRVLDRLLGDESTLRLARLTRTPLFAVAQGRPIPPRRVLVATDFSATAVRAARLALSVAAPDAEILLTHVRGFTGRLAPEGALQRHAENLQTGFCGRVKAFELRGDPATEILACATAQNVDAIAIGKEGVTLAGRGGLGPVATRVVRCANCSVLLAPIGH